MWRICILVTWLLTVLFIPAMAVDESTSDSFMDHPLMQGDHPSQEHFVSEFFNMLFILGMTLVVMLVIAWFLKRFMYSRLQQGNFSSSIVIEDRRSLSPRSMIYILSIGSTRMVIGETPAGIVRLGDLPEHTPSSENQNIQTPFSKLLNKPTKDIPRAG